MGREAEGDPGGPVVKNLPCKAGDRGLIPGGGTRIPHAVEQLSPCPATREVSTLPRKPEHRNKDTAHPKREREAKETGEAKSKGGREGPPGES